MGVTYYSCAHCGDPFAGHTDYEECETCGTTYFCEDCKGYAVFTYYHGKKECETCTTHTPLSENDVTDNEIYKLAFEKSGLKRDDLEKEVLQEKRKRQKKDYPLSCQKCENTECNLLWENTVTVESYEGEEVESRGICCKHNENDDKGFLCDKCEINKILN